MYCICAVPVPLHYYLAYDLASMVQQNVRHYQWNAIVANSCQALRLNNHNAIEIQCAWRVFVAKNVLHALKVADFLKAADENNYDRMLENWCGEETASDS